MADLNFSSLRCLISSDYFILMSVVGAKVILLTHFEISNSLSLCICGHSEHYDAFVLFRPKALFDLILSFNLGKFSLLSVFFLTVII